MRKISLRVHSFLQLVLFSLFANSSIAGEFATTGQSSVPTAGTIHDDLYVTAFPGDVSVAWTSGKTGTITLYSGITLDISAPSHLWIMYKNNTGCTGCSSDTITVSYMKMNKSTGALSTITSVTSTTNNGTLQTTEGTFTDTYDVSAYYYYVTIAMTRSSTSNAQKFYAAVVW